MQTDVATCWLRVLFALLLNLDATGELLSLREQSIGYLFVKRSIGTPDSGPAHITAHVFTNAGSHGL